MNEKEEKKIITQFLIQNFINDRIQEQEQFIKWFSGYLKNYIYKNKIDYKSYDFSNKLNHIIDYFLSPNSKKRFDRMTWEEAEKQTLNWDSWLKKRISDGDDPENVFKVFSLNNDWNAYMLKSPKALSYEGAKMQHCVGGGSYNDRVKNGKIIIYSLRDKNDNPHATIEYNVENNYIHQIQGKNNKPLKQEYIPQLHLFLKKINIPPENINKHSLNINNIFSFNKKLFRYENEEHKANIIFSQIDKNTINTKELNLDFNILKYLPKEKNITISGNISDLNIDGDGHNISIKKLTSNNLKINNVIIKTMEDCFINKANILNNVIIKDANNNNISHYTDQSSLTKRETYLLFNSIVKNNLKEIYTPNNTNSIKNYLENNKEYKNIEKIYSLIDNNISFNNINNKNLSINLIISDNCKEINLNDTNIKSLELIKEQKQTKNITTLNLINTDIFSIKNDQNILLNQYENCSLKNIDVNQETLKTILNSKGKENFLKVKTRRKKGSKRTL